MAGTTLATVPSKVLSTSEPPGEPKLPLVSKDSEVATNAMSAVDKSSQANGKVDVSLEDPQPLPNDVEVIPAGKALSLKV